MTRTYWLSFCDDARPAGDRFLGVAIVDVTDADAVAAAAEVARRFPRANADAGWVAAAIRKAHARGCNPGGAVAFVQLDPDDPKCAGLPRDVVLSRAWLEARGLITDHVQDRRA